MLQVTEIAERVGPSVVGLGRGWGRGSGVVVAKDTVLTNAHVLRGPDVAVMVGGQAVHGRVAGVDPKADLAVIAADTGDAPVIAWDPDREGRIGTPVVALADPGGRGLYATAGAIASLRAGLEHTAPLPRGASGGPLVDGDGYLLGINTVRIEGGFILALRADRSLRAKIDALVSGQQRPKLRLGVALGGGFVVRAVQDASPAAVAGVAPGDRVIAVDDRPVRTVDELLDAIAAAEQVTLTVVRDGDARATSRLYFSK